MALITPREAVGQRTTTGQTPHRYPLRLLGVAAFSSTAPWELGSSAPALFSTVTFATRGSFRHQAACSWHDARATPGEQEWPALRGLPDEVAAYGATELDLVASAELVGQIRRDLAVVEAFDGQLDACAVRRRCDRVAALRLVAVLSGEAHVDVLPCAMSRPAGDVEGKGRGARSLRDDLDDLRDLPGQSPQ